MIRYESVKKKLLSPLMINGTMLATREIINIYIDDQLVSEISPLPGLHNENISTSKKYVQRFIENHFTSYELKNAQLGDGFLFGLYPNLENEIASYPPSSVFSIELLLLNLIHKKQYKSMNFCILDFNAEKYSQKKKGVIKIKIGRNSLYKDIQKISYYIDNTKLLLRLDGNQRFLAKNLHELIKNIPKDRIQYLEEPFISKKELENYIKNYDSTIPLAIDENLNNNNSFLITELPRQIKYGVIKPNLIGGISKALKMSAILKRHGIKTVISSSFEGEIGIKTLNNIHFIYPDSFCDHPGLDTLKYFQT